MHSSMKFMLVSVFPDYGCSNSTCNLPLYFLVEYETIRFNELKRKIGAITYKTLSEQLKGMERDGLIVRREYPQIPPKVEYSLSDKGRSLYPIMEAMCRWGEAHRPDDAAPEPTEKPGE